ncbi:MAG: MFS transporter, partial [Gemmataceae bacterium]
MTPQTGGKSGSRVTRVLTLVAVLPILATVYQTLVLTDLADGNIRRGIESDPGDSTWLTAAWSLSTLYGVFGGLGLSRKFGPRNTLILGLMWFVAGNWLCGYADGFAGMMIARAVEGLGKGICIILLRSFLLSRFDSMLFAAVLCYGLFAYTTRGTSPLVAAWINEVAGWRWIYWANGPIALAAAGMI